MRDCAAETESVDVAIFCLALMGTDYPSFLEEAHRVLAKKGLLWIAEVPDGFRPVLLQISVSTVSGLVCDVLIMITKQFVHVSPNSLLNHHTSQGMLLHVIIKGLRTSPLKVSCPGPMQCEMECDCCQHVCRCGAALPP